MCPKGTCVCSGICPYGRPTAEPREVKEEGTEALVLTFCPSSGPYTRTPSKINQPGLTNLIHREWNFLNAFNETI